MEVSGLLILGVFFLGLLVYGLFSRVLDARSVTPQIAMLVLGLVVGIFAAGSAEIQIDVQLLHDAGTAALILCLFVDAARIDVRALRGSTNLPVRLLGIGLPLTIVAGVAVAIVVLPGIDLLDAILLAILVAPTDAALGTAVVSSDRIPIRIRQALNVESGLNDGLVTPLVLLVISLRTAELDGPNGGWLVEAVRELGIGAISGIVIGVAAAVLLRLVLRRGWIMQGAHWMTAPAIAFIAAILAVALDANAFVAAFTAGLAVTATYGRVEADYLGFGELGGDLLGMAVFFMFGALIPTLGGLDPTVLLFGVLALTVIRIGPVAVALSGAGLAPATIGFIGWFGPRGLASIVLGIVAFGDPSAEPLFAPVVLSAVAATVVFSVIAHGLSAGPAVAAYHRFVVKLSAGSPELDSAVGLRTRNQSLRERGIGSTRAHTTTTD
jgi:NhaP-type Na+/H+ or K+/H+ antiporter